VFGPQKGAAPDDVPQLDANLARLARLIGAGLGDAQGAGAAGGAGFGLLAWGAEIEAGSAAVGEALGMPTAVASADLVITGEGRFDAQSAAGKVPSYLASLARGRGIDAALVAGLIEAPTTEFAHAVSLTDLAGSSDASRADAERWLVEAGATLARGALNR
jgi:glycerate kinase